MKLMNFISEMLSAGVDALNDCSNGNKEGARARMNDIAKKIQTEMPVEKKKPAPWPGQGQM